MEYGDLFNGYIELYKAKGSTLFYKDQPRRGSSLRGAFWNGYLGIFESGTYNNRYKGGIAIGAYRAGLYCAKHFPLRYKVIFNHRDC